MLTPQLRALRVQLETAGERSEEQVALLEELNFLDGFFGQLMTRGSATVPPGQGPKPTKVCGACGRTIP